jgi:hypothetical protein
MIDMIGVYYYDEEDTSSWGWTNVTYTHSSQDDLDGFQYWGTSGFYRGGGFVVDWPSPLDQNASTTAWYHHYHTFERSDRYIIYTCECLC